MTLAFWLSILSDAWAGLQKHWFQLAQTLGIITSVSIGIATLRRGQQSRVVENYLKLTQYHRDIWKIALDKPELYRLFSESESIRGRSLSDTEQQFLTFLFLHLTCFYELQKTTQLVDISAIRADVGSTLRAPLIQQFWDERKVYYNKDFVKFVEDARRSVYS